MTGLLVQTESLIFYKKSGVILCVQKIVLLFTGLQRAYNSKDWLRNFIVLFSVLVFVFFFLAGMPQISFVFLIQFTITLYSFPLFSSRTVHIAIQTCLYVF